jgi:hypothetical protein
VGEQAKRLRFTVTCHRVELGVHLATWIAGDPTPGLGLVHAKWVAFDELADFTLGSAMRRVATWATARTASEA